MNPTHRDHELWNWSAGLRPGAIAKQGRWLAPGRRPALQFTKCLHGPVPLPRDGEPGRVQRRAGVHPPQYCYGGRVSPAPGGEADGWEWFALTRSPGRRDARPTIGQFIGRRARHARFLAAWLRIALCSAIATASFAFGQEARLVNAQTQTHTVATGLKQEFQALVKNQVEPAWIGYAVAIVEGNHHICCSSSEDRHKPASLRHARCKLEGRDEGMNFNTNGDDDGRESPDRVLVLFRAADKTIGKIRVFTDDCELDAGGLTVHWLSEVKPKESIKLLASFVEGPENSKAGRRISESAIAAIALHADVAADDALAKFVEPNHPEEARKHTAFWLGNLRGQKGYEVLRRLVREDPSDKVREHCTFALHVSRVPQAVNAMIEAAREDKSAHVRGQALFWLSQKAGEKAAQAISDAVENDPETEVKKKAVFALSQLPKDEGVPKLINVARKNRNKEVRKDAMFWLGQSNDSRALAFFEEVLTR